MNSDKISACINACNDCAFACEHCATECLQGGTSVDLERCIRLDIDCAAICRLATSYMARNSEAADAVCELCADICKLCAEECERHDHDHCQKCAQACRDCIDACLGMVA